MTRSGLREAIAVAHEYGDPLAEVGTQADFGAETRKGFEAYGSRQAELDEARAACVGNPV